MKLVHTKEKKVLTRQGRLIICGILLAFAALFLSGIYGFLAPVAPCGDAETMVIEGWLDDQSLGRAMRVFEEKGYDRIITTGGPHFFAADLMPYKNYAETTKFRLLKMNVPEEKIICVPAPDCRRNRTFTAGKAIRPVLKANGITEFDLISGGPHARRSRMLFRKALPECEVGVIAIEPSEYNEKDWWTCSAGVRAIINELTAYGYALLSAPALD